MQVIAVPTSPPAPPLVRSAPEVALPGAVVVVRAVPGDSGTLPLLAGLLVVGPVFLQAPWVRMHPSSATLFTAVLLAVGVLLGQHAPLRWQPLGSLLVGFSGSWLAGCLFWGWFRLHPGWHLPIEAFALPLALAGLRGRWGLGAAFYLAALLGTACTDGAMAAIGLMPLWPAVLQAPADQAAVLLQQAALQVMQPTSVMVVLALGAGLMAVARLLARSGPRARLAAAALGTTLAVDAVFVAAALLSPHLSGLI